MFDRSRRAKWVVVLLVAASLAILSIGFRAQGESPFDRLGRGALTVVGPIQKGLVVIFRPVGNFFAGFTKVPSLRARVAELERQNAALQLQHEQVEDVTRENKSLRRLLTLRDRYNLRTLSAQVTGVGPTNFGRAVFIDKGARDGVRKNMPVIGAEGLVGRVTRVGASDAMIVLIIDRSSAVAGRVASSGEQGVIEGRGGARLRLRLLDPEARVREGDRVVTSGYDRGLYPPGIPIGRVSQVPPPGPALTRDVGVEPLVDFSTLDYVLLVLGTQEAAR